MDAEEGPRGTGPRGHPAIRITAMPADTNPYGDIFGGWLMSQMDLAASSIASRHSRGRAVTVAADAMMFHRPVQVGDEVTVWAELVSVGRTSMRVRAEAWRRARDGEATERVTEATFTFVAVGPDRRKRLVPPIAHEPTQEDAQHG